MSAANEGCNRKKVVDRVLARFSLLELLEESESRGWSAVTLDGEQIRNMQYYLRTQAGIAGFELIPNRRGQGVIDTLRPSPQAEAHPNSLSSRYGLEQQPLHTDGAHLEEPPNVVLLWSEQSSDVPTRIWRPRRVPTYEKRGIFSITDGKDVRLAPACDSDGMYRFDPICMRPLDHFSQLLCERFSNPPDEEVFAFQWDVPNTVLLIRNGVVLHGRSRVENHDSERVLFRAAMRKTKHEPVHT